MAMTGLVLQAPSGDRDLLIGSQLLISPDCVFDASLVPETCLVRFVDLKGFTQQVSGESPYRTSAEPSSRRFRFYV